MVFRQLSLKASALVFMLLLGMVLIAGCGAKETLPPSQPDKTIEDTKQPIKDQEPVPEPSKETSAQEPAKEPTKEPTQASAQSNQSTQANSSSIPQIPHPAKAGTDCLGCHKDGINGASKAPHPERQQCMSCHQLAN